MEVDMSEVRVPTKEDLLAVADGAAEESKKESTERKLSPRAAIKEERKQLKKDLRATYSAEAGTYIDDAIAKLATAARSPKKGDDGRVVVVKVRYLRNHSDSGHPGDVGQVWQPDGRKLHLEMKELIKKRSTKDVKLSMESKIGDRWKGGGEYFIVATVHLDK
jgi:hypothetical protein